MLVVIAVMALLAALLIPAVGKSLDASRSIACKSNLRQLGMAFLLFAEDHQGIMPGNHLMTGPDPWQWEWMGQETWSTSPQKVGTLVAYVGGPENARKLYRCPALPYRSIHSGRGSNGGFDYSALGVFAGATTVQLPLRAIWSVSGELMPCPLVVEEDPAEYINSSEEEPAHGGPDRISQTHGGSGNFASTDGGVHQVAGGPRCWDWQAEGPSGAQTSLNYSPGFYGQWKDR